MFGYSVEYRAGADDGRRRFPWVVTKNPELFVRCVRQQNDVYHKTWIIKIEGLTIPMMNMIKSELERITGVWHIVPSKRQYEIGEWKLLVDQSKCAYIHRQLSANWNSIIAIIPQTMLAEATISCSIPTISSKRARDYQDNESDNDDSYGSLLSMGTEVSVLTSEDVHLNDLPEEHKYPSYASAAAQLNKSVTDTQVSSPTTSTYTDWQHEKQQLEEHIREQAAQIANIQADLLSLYQQESM